MSVRYFRPANGSHGEWFMGKFCYNCVREDEELGKECDILTRSLAGDLVEEWIYDEDGMPTCTKFKPKE